MIHNFDNFLNESYKKDQMQKKLKEFLAYLKTTNDLCEKYGYSIAHKDVFVIRTHNDVHLYYNNGLSTPLDNFSKLITENEYFTIPVSVNDEHQITSSLLHLKWKRSNYKFVADGFQAYETEIDNNVLENQMDSYDKILDRGEYSKNGKCLGAIIGVSLDNSPLTIGGLKSLPRKLSSKVRQFYKGNAELFEKQKSILNSIPNKIIDFDFSDLKVSIKTSRFGL